MNVNAVARIAALIGEPARTTMLLRLMDGHAMTAMELVRAAHVAPATGSRHLALMVEAGLLQVTALGRQRYHRIASAQVATLLEDMMRLAGGAPGPQHRAGPRDETLRQARTCYDHLAGRLGVAIANRLAEDRAVVIESDAGWLTDAAAASLGRLGIDASPLLGAAGRTRRVACRPCMDWSERRYHLAGSLGAAICSGCMAKGWLQRKPASRALGITPAGQVALRGWMGLALWRTVTG